MVEQERIDQQPADKHGKTGNRPQNRRARFRTWIRVRWRWIRIRRWQIARWATLILVIVSGLVFASRYVSGDTDPIQFVTGNLLNVLIFAAIVAQVLIYRKQRDIMRHQWKSMQGQLDAMREQYAVEKDFMKLQIHNLADQSTAMEAANELTEQTVRQNAHTVKAMQGQLKAMNEQRELMNTSIENTRQDSIYANRAYVVAKIRGVGREWPQLRLRIQNTGNTPANDVTVAYDCGLREEPPHTEWPDGGVTYDVGYTEVERLGLIAPQSSYHVIETRLVVALDNAQTDQWRSGKLKFYCWGRIYYEDIFNDKRHTDFCFVMSEEHPNGYPYKHGNQAI